MKTISEIRFEEYCVHRGYLFERIELPVSAGRRADYKLRLGSGDVICEVKQIEDGPWEDQITESLKQFGRADASRARW